MIKQSKKGQSNYQDIVNLCRKGSTRLSCHRRRQKHFFSKHFRKWLDASLRWHDKGLNIYWISLQTKLNKDLL